MVLFPGTAAPLHLFEPRYRQLLTDVQNADSRFGILCGMSGVAERNLPAGRIGCVAEVVDVEMMPDGRSNIVVVGRDRFALEAFVEDDAPYHVARVGPVDDVADANPVALTLVAGEVAANFRRVVSAVHTLNDDTSALPQLPDEPEQIAWSIGAMIDLELEAKHRLLSERSAAARLTQIDAVLRKALPDLELRAAMHRG
jgi:Lon protease-like protein